ncbi:hypothetical protein ABIA71_001792 [Stenotrophomonas sp. 2619]|uniref:hypothetical protein n=1 Tax=Stenotrophomonas sp. 2619 TaxID=3156316 RepID=UPI003394A4CE
MKGLGKAHVPLSDENMAVSAAMVAGKSAGRLVVGQVRVDPRSLFQAYKEAGLTVAAWMHGHFDSQLNFSAQDFTLVWGASFETFLLNREGEVRVLTNDHLMDAFKRITIGKRHLGIQGLQRQYSSGISGDES